MTLRIHAICLALNEDMFIHECLKSIYASCSGISVITQYDRDYYGNLVEPDDTVRDVLEFPDPEGKIHLVLRRYRDETVARNHEMQAVCLKPFKGVRSHGVPMNEIRTFHQCPDYFLIIDADEIYDVETLPRIIEYLDTKRPRGMRVTAYQYGLTWNQRMPLEKERHHHFGFIKPGITFETRRKVSWNESRLSSLLGKLALPDFSSRFFGFIDCPIEIGVFHHASYIGGKERLLTKFKKHSHQEVNNDDYIDHLLSKEFDQISTDQLPINIQGGRWSSDIIQKV